MAPSVRALLLAPPQRQPRWSLELLAVALGVFVPVFALYALDVFSVGGGVVFLAGHAAMVGVAVGGVLAYRERGLVYAWLAVNAALWGYAADHYLLGLGHQPIAARVGALVRLDGVAVLAVQAVILGTLAWGAGRSARWLVGTAQRAVPAEPPR